MIQTNKRINVRRTPAGARVGTLPLNAKTPVLDFEITDRNQQKRYYKIRYNGLEGYIYSGDQRDYKDWATTIDDNENPSAIVASVGDEVQINAPVGINQRQTPGGRYMQRIPKDEINSGLVVARPNLTLYWDMLSKLNDLESSTGGDQGFQIRYFHKMCRFCPIT